MNRRPGFFLQLFVVFLSLAAALVLIAIGSCSRPSSPDAVQALQEEAGTVPAWEALAILKTGENPLWFELGEAGPALIPSPEEAGLGDYKPWPLSRRIAGMLSWEDSLVLASNREGFIILSPRFESGATLYRSSDPAYWDAYSIASFFIYEEKPSILLYRDDFFTDPAAPLAAPALSLGWEFNVPIPIDVAFLQSPIAGDNWEPNALTRAADGFWYARWAQPGIERPQSRYLKASSLAEHGDQISVDAYRHAAQPGPISAAPPFVVAFFNNVPRDFTDGLGYLILELVSPSYGEKRLFSAGGGSSAFQDNENMSPLYGFYRESPAPFFFAVLPDGRGISGGEGVVAQFELPVLPEAYVYTGVGLAGDVLVAAWEEQEGSAVGSAGFMVVEAGAFLPDYPSSH
ncbi:hypothetical protein [Leadbettera azotonutricia]|uniref:Putative lipoprotein n=1 Tax=Leadbettera azotonutricia (strain ATCC BAA-888 / DSM 13862 / ZAS-9) TaxID=545695 RepID=F5Y9Q8_LEAAZ|nr:hypothetical protein [Leadbettera azotonutricia]AEF83494.1 putative lipoprotein [Leadbettera azotonutricia ZAS-9]